MSSTQEKAISPKNMRQKMAQEPIYLAQVIALNNPGALQSNLSALGIDGYSESATPEEMVEFLMDLAPELSPQDLKAVFDVDFMPGENLCQDAGYFEAFKLAAEEQGLDPQTATFTEVFEPTVAQVGEAVADFRGEEYKAADNTEAPSKKGPCMACRVRRLQNFTQLLMLVAVVLFIALIIKRW
mgnify:CR=1 FL=1